MAYIKCGVQGGACSMSPTGLGNDPQLPSGHTSISPLYFGNNADIAVSASSKHYPLPKFVGRVTIHNKQQGGILVPEYTIRNDMQKIAEERGKRYGYFDPQKKVGLGNPAGFTRSDLSIRFDNLKCQWLLSSGKYHYQGGIIYLDLELTVYVVAEAKNKPRCRDLIMKHEMSHVEDELEIVNKTLPTSSQMHKSIISDFSSPIKQSDFDKRIRGSGDGSGSELEQFIQRKIWVFMSSNKAEALHKKHPKHADEISFCLQT